MKKLNRITIEKLGIIMLTLPIILLASCTDLQENTSGALSPDTFYETEADLEAAVIPMYRYFSGAFRNAQGQIAMFAGDDLTTRPGANKAQFRNFDRYNYAADATWLQTFAYQPYWKTIHAANAILENIGESPVGQEFKDQIAGQAHFMRGLSYFMLVRTFGGVPLMTSTESTGEESRATVLAVYELIEEDLQFAESNLPQTWNNAAGRATSGAAKTALASAYLTWAGWPLKDESKYALAAEKAKEVMDSGTYSLMSDYLDLWLTENDNNSESIFAIQWSRDANNFINRMAQGYRAFEEHGWTDGYAEIALFKRFPEGPRKEATYQTVFETSDGTTVNWQDSQFGHPTYKKWIVGGVEAGNVLDSGKNVPLFRYAEVLLTFAEAEAMANGGPNSQAYEAINRVRERAGLSDLSAGMSQSAFQEAVIAERSYELAGEYTRWFDMVRTETVEEVAEQRHTEEHPLFQTPTKEQYLAPIPAIEIQQNPNLVQNPEGNKIR